jgi:acyl phosphate:glycerol-3-phosphate acyltransferase
MKIILIVLGSYLLGSIPFSHIFPRLKGKDVSKDGTRNIGATNALVVAGPFLGALALAGDIAKGYLAIYLAQHYSGIPWVIVLAGIAAVIGHDFSIFLRFRGGKGIATTGGILLAIDPFLTIIITLTWILMIIVTKYFIPSTLVMLGLIPFILFLAGKRIEYIAFGFFAFLIALYTHRNDIQRMISGKELKTSDAMRHYIRP